MLAIPDSGKEGEVGVSSTFGLTVGDEIWVQADRNAMNINKKVKTIRFILLLHSKIK
jgi:hypothetical protein